MRVPRFPRVSDAFEILIAWLCLVSGVPMLLDRAQPNSVISLLPEWLVRLWGINLALGGLLILLGYGAWRHRSRTFAHGELGLGIEQAGLCLLGSGTLVFGIIIVMVAGWAGMLPAGTYLVFTAACLFRYIEISDIKRGLMMAAKVQRDGG